MGVKRAPAEILGEAEVAQLEKLAEMEEAHVSSKAAEVKQLQQGQAEQRHARAGNKANQGITSFRVSLISLLLTFRAVFWLSAETDVETKPALHKF